MENENRIGEKHLTNEGYWVTIIEYFGVRKCTVQFDNGYIVYNRQYRDIKIGTVKNPFHPSVYGVGYLGIGSYTSKIDGKITKIYKTWNHMMERCYSKNKYLKHPSYIKCTVDKRWHNFQVFAEWFEETFKEWMDSTWQLDKDILIKGNKIYSPETCCLVPSQINSTLIKCDRVRGNYPIGVYKSRQKFKAQSRIGEDRIQLGYFDTIEEAFQAYKIAKEEYIKKLANDWRGQITEPCYEALMNYEVEITD